MEKFTQRFQGMFKMMQVKKPSAMRTIPLWLIILKQMNEYDDAHIVDYFNYGHVGVFEIEKETLGSLKMCWYWYRK